LKENVTNTINRYISFFTELNNSVLTVCKGHFTLCITIRVVSVAGLESAFLSTATATHTQYKYNKKVWDFNEQSSPVAHQPAIGTTQYYLQALFTSFIQVFIYIE
jgi:hypothetical protein